jgi:uncharacterized protein
MSQSDCIAPLVVHAPRIEDNPRSENSQLRHCPVFRRIDVCRIILNLIAMRLGANEVEAIREEIRQSDPAAEIYLFGSRTNDAAKGGDIDLLVISDTLGFRDVLRLRTAILDRIGWQQLDLVVRRRKQLSEPLAAVARETGVKL